jgi:hypothetical protein
MPKCRDRLKRAEHLRSRASPRVSKKRRFGRQTRPASRASLGAQGQQGSSEAPGSSRTRGPPSLAQSTQNGCRCFARSRTRCLLLVRIRVLGPGRKPDKDPVRRTSWTTHSRKFVPRILRQRVRMASGDLIQQADRSKFNRNRLCVGQRARSEVDATGTISTLLRRHWGRNTGQHRAIRRREGRVGSLPKYAGVASLCRLLQRPTDQSQRDSRSAVRVRSSAPPFNRGSEKCRGSGLLASWNHSHP